LTTALAVTAVTAFTAVTVAIFLVGEDTAVGEAAEDDEDDAGEADVEARMRPAKGVFLARQGEGRFSGRSAAVSVSLSGDADSVAPSLGEAGAAAADAEAAADTDDAADNDGEPASTATAATAAVSTTSPSAMLRCLLEEQYIY
jgi:hypothetical protein